MAAEKVSSQNISVGIRIKPTDKNEPVAWAFDNSTLAQLIPNKTPQQALSSRNAFTFGMRIEYYNNDC